MSICGLVLAGGPSTRMGEDKGRIVYPSVSPLESRARALQVLNSVCDESFLSVQRAASFNESFDNFHFGVGDRDFTRNSTGKPFDLSHVIFDSVEGAGPGVGILSAVKSKPDVDAWFVLACDFPFATDEAVLALFEARDPRKGATVFEHADGTIEPLFAIWEKSAIQRLQAEFEIHRYGPRFALEKLECKRLRPFDAKWLLNVNTPADREHVR